jgi:hypothetical protein
MVLLLRCCLFFIFPIFASIAPIAEYYDTLHETTKHESPFVPLKTLITDL